MAERRMFAKTIIDSDVFLNMPLSTQSLYFHLNMRADDDGFINNPKEIQRLIGCSDDDLKLLIAKRFIIPFESGIVVIKHWIIHNYIQKDRYKPTIDQEGKNPISEKGNEAYTECIHGLSVVDTQVRLGKESTGKGNGIGAKSAQPIPVEEEISPKSQEKGKGTTQDPPEDRKRLNLSEPELKALFQSYTADQEVIKLLLEWADIRKAKKSINTETAIRNNLNKMNSMANQSGFSVAEYLEEVIARSWIAFFPIKNFQNGMSYGSGGRNGNGSAFQFPPLQTPMRVFDSSKDEF